jgi:uncharacterized protein
MRVINETTGECIVANLAVAESPLARMRGLLGRDSLPVGEGLLLQPCKGVHTFGMKFSIDVIFLNGENKVVAVRNNLPPNRLTRIFLSSSSVLELPAGTLESMTISPGDVLILA